MGSFYIYKNLLRHCVEKIYLKLHKIFGLIKSCTKNMHTIKKSALFISLEKNKNK